jgi:glycerol-3-phosphate dehydrogenase (NAD(P)+)
MKVAFVGAGRWALALAGQLAAKGLALSMWEADKPSLARLLKTRNHPDLPPDQPIPESVEATGDLAHALAGADIVVFAVPSAALKQAADAVRSAGGRPRAVVTVTKGIDPGTLRRMSVVLRETLHPLPVVVLAGPGIPYDFALGDPTSLVAASEDEASALLVRDSFSGGNLRVYSHADVVGVELGAALKNVMALAAGMLDGLGLGINAKSALLARGLAEMIRLGIAFNANPMTFAGLSGMGDLIVTAFSEHSRNHTLGRAIGAGADPGVAQRALAGVAEGAVTARSARTLAARQGVEMPIVEEVCRILYEGSAPKESLERLLRRSPKQEVWK